MHGDVNVWADAADNRHRLRDHVCRQIRVISHVLVV